VLTAVPYNGATNVGVNVTPGVVISKPIDPVSLNSSTFTVTNAGTPLAGSYWFNSANTRIEFVPNAPLPASTHLVMTLNKVLDLVGNPVSFSAAFNTGAGPDFQQPYVLYTSASSNESIPINSSIKIQFSESMDVTSFSTNNLYLYDDLLGIGVPATVTWSSDQSAAFLVPTAPLAAGRNFTLYVNGGTDLAGNQMASFSQNLYAELSSASSAPTVLLTNPLNGGTGLGTNAVIEAELSGPVDSNYLAGVTLKAGSTVTPSTASLSSGNAVVQLTPQNPLTPNTTYTVTLAGLKDPAGNAMATYTYTFTTGATFDNTAPTVVNYDPPYNGTVGTNVIPKMLFSKPLNPLTVSNGTMRMFLVDTNQFIPLTVTVSANDLQVTLQPQIPLLPNTRYHFQACCGFQDQDGNTGTQGDIYFYTGGGTVSSGPTVSVSPVANATGIPLNT
jgi:hypothetical protein